MKSSYLTAFANRELYDLAPHIPEAQGYVPAPSVRLREIVEGYVSYGLVAFKAWKHREPQAGDLCRVEYVTGPRIGLTFLVDFGELRQVL